MHYIGADIHIKSIDFAVVNETGRVSKRCHIETSGQGIIDFVKSVGKPRQIIIEEGTLADWIKGLLESRGEKVVITDPKENRWIGRAQQKDDDIDAEKLARLQHGGYTKEIYHLSGERRWFKELIYFYHDQVKSRTRLKNKLKAKFRQNGIACTGATVYQKRSQEHWLNMLPPQGAIKWQVSCMMKHLGELEEHINDTKKQIVKMAKSYKEISRIRMLTGINWIHASTISAIIGDIHRFSNKKKLWMYAGLGLASRKSGGKVLKSGLSCDYNRMLKKVFKMAARSAIRAKDNPFRKQYLQLTIEKGKLPHRAELTVARSIAATVYGIWKNKTDYNPDFRKRSEMA